VEFVHIRNLEKFHPGYKDRELLWAKIYFGLVQGDPEFELIEEEIDKWRFVAMICLELKAKTPLPNQAKYWRSKGFNLRKRPMSLTLRMLHNFIESVTQDGKLCGTDKEEEEDKEEKKRIGNPVTGDETIIGMAPTQLSEREGFVAAWKEWIAYRQEIKRKVSVIAARKQLAFLLEQPNPIAVIEQSIRNQWQGLFELKTGGGQGGSKQTKEYSGIDRQKFNDFVNRRSRRDSAKS